MWIVHHVNCSWLRSDSLGLSGQAYSCLSFTALGSSARTFRLTLSHPSIVTTHPACTSWAKRHQIHTTLSITHHPELTTIGPHVHRPASLCGRHVSATTTKLPRCEAMHSRACTTATSPSKLACQLVEGLHREPSPRLRLCNSTASADLLRACNHLDDQASTTSTWSSFKFSSCINVLLQRLWRFLRLTRPWTTRVDATDAPTTLHRLDHGHRWGHGWRQHPIYTTTSIMYGEREVKTEDDDHSSLIGGTLARTCWGN